MDAEKPDEWFSAEVATFGDRLAAAREAAGLTQKALAQRLGVRHTTVQAWENDAADPRANRLQMLAGMLGVSLMWLLTGQGDGLQGPGAAAEGPPRGNAELRGMLRGIRRTMTELDERLGRLETALSATEENKDA
jgi:transcriptional regulator with XRE-family HTH domain